MIHRIKVLKASDYSQITQLEDADIVFIEIQEDTIGRSGANPIWGKVIKKQPSGELKYIGIGLHKDYDYDYPKSAYSEKIFSIIGKEILPQTRVPNIDVVEREQDNHGIISYRVLDNDAEDLMLISDIIFNKFTRTEIRSKHSIYKIEDILECIRIQVPDKDNYKEIEKSVIHTLLLDCVTNNGDRHPDNWALVREKKSNKYSLAIFDFASAFIDMLESNPWQKDGWSVSYIDSDDSSASKIGIGLSGDKLVEIISKKYPEYYKEFVEIFSERLLDIIEKIEKENLPIDNNRLIKRLRDKNIYLSKFLDKGEIEHEQT